MERNQTQKSNKGNRWKRGVLWKGSPVLRAICLFSGPILSTFLCQAMTGMPLLRVSNLFAKGQMVSITPEPIRSLSLFNCATVVRKQPKINEWTWLLCLSAGCHCDKIPEVTRLNVVHGFRGFSSQSLGSLALGLWWKEYVEDCSPHGKQEEES